MKHLLSLDFMPVQCHAVLVKTWWRSVAGQFGLVLSFKSVSASQLCWSPVLSCRCVQALKVMETPQISLFILPEHDKVMLKPPFNLSFIITYNVYPPMCCSVLRRGHYMHQLMSCVEFVCFVLSLYCSLLLNFWQSCFSAFTFSCKCPLYYAHK